MEKRRKDNRMKKLYLPLALLLIAIFAIVSGCSSTPTTTSKPATTTPVTTKPATTAPATLTPQNGGTLRISMNADAFSLGYPPTMQGTPDQLSARPCIESLFRMDNSGNTFPYLVDTVKEDPAAKTFTFVLKKGITFHDGTPFNAAAVQWNMTNFKASPSGSATFAKITSVDAVDEYTVRVNLSSWDNTLLTNLVSPPGYMISPTAFQKNGADWCRNNPVGTGPFKFVSWTRDVSKTFEKNTNYWQAGKPYLDKIVISIIADATVEEASLLKGENDILSIANVKNASDAAAQGFIISKCPVGGGLRTMIGDSGHADSPFYNLKVRQAVSYAIDPKAIVDSVWKGMMPVTNQFATQGTWAYNPNVVGYPYSVTKAKQFLADAGYPTGFKTTIYCTNDPYQVSCYTAVQGFLQAVGIEAQLQVLDSSKWVDMQQNTGWNNALYGQGILVAADPLSNFQFLTSTSTSSVAKVTLKNADLDKTFSDASAATDFNTKKDLTWKLQVLVHDTYCIWNPILVNVGISAKSKKVHGDGISDMAFGLWAPENAWMGK
jgi:peptide/nickel transport system substrate-binding protein